MNNVKKVLVTGSHGLIGSECVEFFCRKGLEVVGVDNNMRRYFFGDDGDTQWRGTQLADSYKNYYFYDIDIRSKEGVEALFKKHAFGLIIHCAAQPSHDWAAREPFTDFTINANGTLMLLEHFRQYCPDSVFIFTSTNKVYGDTPNQLPLVEQETRFELSSDHSYYGGIDETMSIDHSTHSLFGASKVAADVLVQEYGRYFKLKTVSFRGGCLTGPAHSGAQLHGFLSYLAKCIDKEIPYTIFGYKGKQVRDNIHSRDLVNAFFHFYENPRCGEVYNIGGSRYSHISVLEAITKLEKLLNKKARVTLSPENRIGDHIWYISSVAKFKAHYPGWDYQYDIDRILDEIVREKHW